MSSVLKFNKRRSKVNGKSYFNKIYIQLYIIFIPVLLYYLIFVYLPMLGAIIAFKDYNFLQGVFGSDWAGLKHFKRFILNGDFWKTFRNTMLLNGGKILFGFPTPIIFALLLNEVRNRSFKKVTQTISYLPHFVSWVVVAGFAYSFLSPSIGLVNQIIKIFGGESIFFLAEAKYFPLIIIFTHIWKELGWTAIIYLATLSSVNIQLYEAAVLDGANKWQQLIHVTLPSIRSVISIMLILNVGQILNSGFDQIFVFINTAVSEVGETIDYYVYRVGIMQINNFSYSTAVGLFKGVVALILIISANYIAKKIDEDGGVW